MTVLLIDASGHTREMEISRFLPVILVPLPRPLQTCWTGEKVPLVYEPLPIAEFVYSDECSYPPVYRQKLSK